MAGLVAIDAPLDCSGSGRGEQQAPTALRAAGLLERLGATDGGVAKCAVSSTDRDPACGVIGVEDIRRGAVAIAEKVRAAKGAGGVPLVVGGDCTLLLGVFAGLEPGTALLFVDGHADFHDGSSSPTGEAADMDLAILTGHGPRGLTSRRLVDPSDVWLLGHRPSSLSTDAAEENDRIDPRIRTWTAPAISAHGPIETGQEVCRELDGRAAWLHLDLDVLDESELPAVTYAQPMGLRWDELSALAKPLVMLPGLAGVSVADFNPDLDPVGEHAARTVEFLGSLLAPFGRPA